MGAVENIKVECAEFSLTNSDHTVTLKWPKGQIRLDSSIAMYLQSFKHGMSIKDLIESFRKTNQPVSLSHIHSALDILYTHGLIKNSGSFRHMIEGLRTPYHWPPSLARTDFFLIKLLGGFHSQLEVPLLANLCALVIFFIGTASLFQMVANAGPSALTDSLTSGMASLPHWIQIHPLGLLAIYWALNSALLSLRSLVLNSFSYLSARRVPSLYLRCDLLGLYLYSETEASNLSPKYGLLQFVGGTSTLFLAPQFIVLKPLFPYLAPFYFTTILLQWSPFEKSDFVQILAFIYNRLRFQSAVKNERFSAIKRWFFQHYEKWLYYIHLSYSVLWVFLLAYLSLHFVDLIELLIGSMDSVSYYAWAPAKIEVAVVGLYLTTLLISQVFQIIENFNYGIKKWSRRLWQKAITARLVEPIASDSDFAIADFLRKTPPFDSLEPSVVNEIASYSQLQWQKRGDMICRQGELTRDLYFILEGVVGVYRQLPLRPTLKIVELKEGSFFGEVGFFRGINRTASVIALQPTQLLKVGYPWSQQSHDMDAPRFRKMQDRLWLMQSMVTNDIFRNLGFEVIRLFLDSGQIHDVSENRILIEKGKTQTRLFVIIQGEVEVYVGLGQSRRLARGQVFGEISILFNTLATATVVTTKPSKLLVIEAEPFWQILANNFSLALAMEFIARKRLQNNPTKRNR